MGTETSLGRRAGTVARWPVGMGLAFWRYLWRTMPLHRSDEEGSPDRDLPPPLPDGLAADRLQRLEDGSGPLFRRRYWVRIVGSRRTPEELMGLVLREPNRAAPVEVAVFRKTRAAKPAPGRRVRGPHARAMDGPVGCRPDPDLFRSPPSRATWRPGRSSSGPPEVTASASNRVLCPQRRPARRAAVRPVKLARRCSCTCGPFASGRQAVRGRVRGGITSTPGSTSRRPVALTGRRARRALEALRDKGFNFDPDQRSDHYTTENGWKVDDYAQPLPPEPPGPPVPGGSFEVAQRLLRDYEFADPAIVRAVYAEDSPFETRDMLLEGRFYGLKFHFGVRVGGLVDDELAVDGHPVRRWGWNYRTLQGHLEAGQMDYEVRKWLDTGEVDFRIHAFSRPAHIPNPVIRLGFRVFGRWVQRRFARHACQRMARLTAARARVSAAAQDPPATSP